MNAQTISPMNPRIFHRYFLFTLFACLTSFVAGAIAPTGLVITVTSPTEMRLLWKDNSSDEEAFTVERRVSGGEFEAVATLPANSTSFQDKGLTTGKSYSYRVSATSKGGPPAGIEARVSLTPPAEPRGMLGWSPSGKEIVIQWTDRSKNADGFVIERRANEPKAKFVEPGQERHVKMHRQWPMLRGFSKSNPNHGLPAPAR